MINSKYLNEYWRGIWFQIIVLGLLIANLVVSCWIVRFVREI